MSDDEREQFISQDEEELRHIRERKIRELTEKKRRMSTHPTQVTDSDFNKIVQEHPIALIDFWAAWCGPCKALAPTIDEIAGQYAGRVFVGKLDVDENPNTAECFQVFSVPTMLIMKNGKEVDRIVGLCPKSHIEEALNKHLG